jgi:hypothetical protein
MLSVQQTLLGWMTVTRGAGILAVLMVGLLGACLARSLSDSDLVSYAAKGYDKKAMQGKHLVLGAHHGISVVVEFPCSDLCPAYTTRIIHYDLPPDGTCAAQGGVTVLIGTPVGIGEMPVQYCVPKVLADNPQVRPG